MNNCSWLKRIISWFTFVSKLKGRSVVAGVWMSLNKYDPRNVNLDAHAQKEKTTNKQMHKNKSQLSNQIYTVDCFSHYWELEWSFWSFLLLLQNVLFICLFLVKIENSTFLFAILNPPKIYFKSIKSCVMRRLTIWATT